MNVQWLVGLAGCWAVALGGGCGGKTYKFELTCDQPNLGQCSVLKTDDEAFEASAEAACTSQAGAVSHDDCPDKGLLATCTIHPANTDAEIELFVYPSTETGVATSEDARSFCKAASGAGQ